ncbi:Zinc knuckle family protein [Aphelenchoides avenae]|nr:Zinc knuckle family protein [Aphelenchus avenae]
MSSIGGTTLFECLKVTAANPVTGVSRHVIVFFDSGSSRSFATSTLARDLDLPRHAVHRLQVTTFGAKLPTNIEGFSTSIVLSSNQRHLPSLEFITRDCIVPSVRTALVEQPDLPALRRNERTLTPITTTPDILIGQDLVSYFQRHQGLALPSGFYVVQTILGPTVGGCGTVATTNNAAATTSRAAIATTNRGTLCSGESPQAVDAASWHPSTSIQTLTKAPSLLQSHHRSQTIATCATGTSSSDSTHSVEDDTNARSYTAQQDFSLSVEKNEFSGSMTSTSSCKGRHTLSDHTVGPQPPRKYPNQLDTTAPLPPPSTSHVLLPPEHRTKIQSAKPAEQHRLRGVTDVLTQTGTPDALMKHTGTVEVLLPGEHHADLPVITPSASVLDYHHADFYDDCVPTVVCVAVADVAEPTARGQPSASGATKARTAKASAPAHAAGDDAEENSASAHSAANEEESDEPQEDSRRQPSACRTTKAANNLAHGPTSHMNTGSSQHPFAQDRCAQPHPQGRHQQCTARRDACVTPTTIHPANPLSIVRPKPASNTIDGHSTGHQPIDARSSRPHLALGRAPRADHADQGSSLQSRSPTIHATRSGIVGQAHQASTSVSYHLAGTDAAPSEKRTVKCAYCGRPHFAGRCNVYATIAQRLKRLRQMNHCIRCLRGGHWSDTCPNNATCLHCASSHPHHVSLCRAYISRSTRQAGNAPAAPQEPARTAQAAQRKKTEPKVRTAPAATHSVANGANSSGRSTAIGNFPPVLNNFCRSDQPSSATPPKKRDNPHSEKNRSAADPSPAQPPSSLLSSLGHKDALCASSGRTSLQQQLRMPGGTGRNRRDHKNTSRDDNREYSSRDEKTNQRSMDQPADRQATTQSADHLNRNVVDVCRGQARGNHPRNPARHSTPVVVPAEAKKQLTKEPSAHQPPGSRGYSDSVMSAAVQATTAHSLPSPSANNGPLPSSDVFAGVTELVNLLGAKIDAVCEVIASLQDAAAKPPTKEPTEANHRHKPRKHRKRKSTK